MKLNRPVLNMCLRRDNCPSKVDRPVLRIAIARSNLLKARME